MLIRRFALNQHFATQIGFSSHRREHREPGDGCQG